MTLRTKMLLIIGVTLICGVGALYLTSRFTLMRSLTGIEEQEAQKHVERVLATFQGLGMTPLMLLGAADIYRFVGNNTPLADQTSRQPDPSLDTILDTLSGRLSQNGTS